MSVEYRYARMTGDKLQVLPDTKIASPEMRMDVEQRADLFVIPSHLRDTTDLRPNGQVVFDLAVFGDSYRIPNDYIDGTSDLAVVVGQTVEADQITDEKHGEIKVGYSQIVKQFQENPSDYKGISEVLKQANEALSESGSHYGYMFNPAKAEVTLFRREDEDFNQFNSVPAQKVATIKAA